MLNRPDRVHQNSIGNILILQDITAKIRQIVLHNEAGHGIYRELRIRPLLHIKRRKLIYTAAEGLPLDVIQQ